MNRVLLLSIILFISTAFLVSAGPGTHRYEKPHSNYGLNEKKNKDHIQEHIKTLVKDEKEQPELSEEDTIYYLFVIHDLNGDGYLDGHELRAAFTDLDNLEEGQQEDLLPLNEVNEMVDHVLMEDDRNGDGLISWSEYLESQLYHEE